MTHFSLRTTDWHGKTYTLDYWPDMGYFIRVKDKPSIWNFWSPIGYEYPLGHAPQSAKEETD